MMPPNKYKCGRMPLALGAEESDGLLWNWGTASQRWQNSSRGKRMTCLNDSSKQRLEEWKGMEWVRENGLSRKITSEAETIGCHSPSCWSNPTPVRYLAAICFRGHKTPVQPEGVTLHRLSRSQYIGSLYQWLLVLWGELCPKKTGWSPKTWYKEWDLIWPF